MKHAHLAILILLISFGSIGAVIYTPGLPQIASYFLITDNTAQATVSCYLIGYAVGQLLYGPLANRFGSRLTIKIGAVLAIVGSIGCIFSYYANSFSLLILSRCVMALGAACGLKMTFTVSSKLFSYEENARAMGLLTMAFAITPGLGVYLGSVLVSAFNWTGPFYLMTFYSWLIFILANKLPEVYSSKDYHALRLVSIYSNYAVQLKDKQIIFGGLVLGLCCTSIIYIFATVAPFIAMDKMRLDPLLFGVYNFAPSIGILGGSITSSLVGKVILPQKSLLLGLLIGMFGIIILAFALFCWPQAPISLFMPMIIVYFGLSFVFGNAGALTLQYASDKGSASAMMSFINMGSGVLMVTLIGFLDFSHLLILPLVYVILLVTGFICFKSIKS